MGGGRARLWPVLKGLKDTMTEHSFLFFLIFKYFKIYIYFLAALQGLRDLSSPTRDRTHAPCSGSAESKPMDGQGIPHNPFCLKNKI